MHQRLKQKSGLAVSQIEWEAKLCFGFIEERAIVLSRGERVREFGVGEMHRSVARNVEGGSVDSEQPLPLLSLAQVLNLDHAVDELPI